MKPARYIWLLALLLLAAPANAVDFSKVVMDDEGKPICMEAVREGECPPDKIATLGRVVRIALYTTFPDEQNLSGEEKYKRGELAQGLAGAGDTKVKLEDLLVMKKVVGKLYGPGVVKPAWDLLEGK